MQAKEKSGSLTTANYGYELNRNIFAFPGDVNNADYCGSNVLLTNGAKCILNYKDVLQEYSDFKDIMLLDNNKLKSKKVLNIPKEYEEIYLKLAKGKKNIEELKKELNIDISFLNSKLTLMELERLYREITWRIF